MKLRFDKAEFYGRLHRRNDEARSGRRLGRGDCPHQLRSARRLSHAFIPGAALNHPAERRRAAHFWRAFTTGELTYAG